MSPLITAAIPHQPILLTARDAAKLLSVSERTLFSISAPRGPLPVVKIGRAVRYAVADLQAYIEGQRKLPCLTNIPNSGSNAETRLGKDQ